MGMCTASRACVCCVRVRAHASVHVPVRMARGLPHLLLDDLGRSHHELVPLTPHVLDEHGQVEQPAPRDLHGVGVDGVLHLEGHVGLQLLRVLYVPVSLDLLGAGAGTRATVR